MGMRVVEDKREQIVELCKRYHVQRLELFGSALRDDFQVSSSDLDFLVEFNPLTQGSYADTYLGLQNALESLFNRTVDLVEVLAIQNPYYREEIERTKVLIYAA